MQTNKVFLLLLFFYFVQFNLIKSQDIKFARKIITDLCSREFAGRGYSNGGDSLAAFYIADNLKKLKIKPFNDSYFQDFTISINTFPGTVRLKINDSTLIPGYDYLVLSSSGSIRGIYPVVKMDHKLIDFPENLQKVSESNIQKSFLLIDTVSLKNKGFKDALDNIINHNLFKARGIIEIEYKNLMYSPSPFVKDFPHIKIHRDAVPDSIKSLSITVDNKFIKKYTTRNIAACLPGKSDSLIVFSAHYDHIGQMGLDTYFPGANDNASGVAMVLDMIKYFTKNKKDLKYSMAFLFFSAEELGLVGSRYFAENPLFPLSKVKMLVNLDMVGSGDKGITVVNGTVFKNEFDKLTQLNNAKKYLPEIAIRGPAANSDHYSFYEKGVKSFFIYTRGEYSEYHSIYDRAQDLPLSKYEGLFKLLVDFTKSL